MKRKAILIFTLLTLASLCISAGAATTENMARELPPLLAAGDDGKVILRWVWPPGSLIPPEYNLYRKKKGTATWVLVNGEPIKKVETEEEAREILGDEDFEKYKGILFPKLPSPKESPGGLREVLQNLNQLWSAIMLTADLNSKVADLLGVRYVDTGVKNGETYVYKLTSVKNGKEQKIGESSPVTPGKVVIHPPQGFRGKEGDKVVLLAWNQEPRFSAYDVYRSEKMKGRYERINKNPIVIVSSMDKEGNVVRPEWTYADRSVENGKTYWYVLIGRDPFGRISRFTKPISITPRDLTPPFPPTRLSVKIEEKDVYLTWEKPPDEDLVGYNVYRSLKPTEGFVRVNEKLIERDTLTFVQKGLKPGTKYWYHVTAVDESGNESQPTFSALAYVLDKVPPKKPSGLKAEVEPGKVSLTWDKNLDDDLAGYYVYWSTNPNFEKYFLANNEPNKENSFVKVLPKGASDKPFYFRVKAVDTSGNFSEFSDTLEVTLPDVTPPARPAFKVYMVESNRVRLFWYENGDYDLKGYLVYRRETSEKEAALLTEKALPSDDTSFVDESVRPGATYEYFLRAVDQAGNLSDPSSPLTVECYDSTPPSPPKRVTASVDEEKPRIRIAWDLPEDPDLKGVVLFRGYKKIGPFYPLTEVEKITSYEDERVKPGRTYYYRLTAYDEFNNRSAPSRVIAVTVPEAKGK